MVHYLPCIKSLAQLIHQFGMQSFILFDGILFEGTGNCISAANRSFRYGDGVFETMRVNHGAILWADYHYRRLMKAAFLIKLRLPESFTFDYFSSLVDRLYGKNHPEGGAARIRFSLFRKDGGYYTPSDNHASYLIESERLESSRFALNTGGLRLGIYPHQRKAVNPFSNLKTSSALLYVMAAIYKEEQQLDDCVVLNEHGLISESISSNIFVVHENKVMTPGLDQGCVEGVMRAVLMKLMRDKSICIEEVPIHPSVLYDADEVFVTNTINGVRWVHGFGGNPFTNWHAKVMVDLLNQAVAGIYNF